MTHLLTVSVLIQRPTALRDPKMSQTNGPAECGPINAGWRGKLARYVCTQLLDPFDPDGCHCQ